MPTPARAPWYRRGKRMWYYTTGDGRQHALGVRDPDDRAGAEAAAGALVERLAAEVAARLGPAPVQSPGDCTGALQVAAAAARFLADCGKRVAAGKLAPATLKNYRRQVGEFARAFGPRPVGTLRPDEVTEWADRPGWSQSYQHAALGAVQACLRFNRVAMPLRRPPRESRGADSVLSDEQFARVLAAVRGPWKGPGKKGDLAELLEVLWETGARPQEVAQLTVEAVDWSGAPTRLRRHKTRRKTGRDRPLYFPEAAMAVLREQRARYGTGFLLRTRFGRPYSPAAVVRRMIEVSKKVGFHVTAYCLRHTYATRALAAGVPDAQVAALLGHAGTGMLHFHYSHLVEQARLLRDAAERVSRSAG